MWRKYLSEVRKLASRGDLSEDQVALLAFSPEARLALMNETDGDVGAFGEGTVPRVLQHARQTAQAETKEFPRGSISRIRFDCACSGSTRRLKARPIGGASRRSTAKMRSLSAKPDTCVTRPATKATTTRADARNGIARDQEGGKSTELANPVRDLIFAVERRLAPPLGRALSRLVEPEQAQSNALSHERQGLEDGEAKDA